MNKDSQNLRKRLVSSALLLSMLLNGCGEDNSKKIYVGNSTDISYTEDTKINGKITAEKVDKYIKIVTFKQDDVVFTRLVAIEDYISYGGRLSIRYNSIGYTDLDSGTTLISYKIYDANSDTPEHITYSVGENLEIVSVIDLMPYLYQEGKFADTYDITDLLSFYHEKVEPTLEETNEITLS